MRQRWLAPYPLLDGEAAGWAVQATLGLAPGWTLSHDQLLRLRDLCTNANARQSVESYLNEEQAPVSIYQWPMADDRWRIGRYELTSVAAVEAKMAQYPRGTAFTWTPTRMGPPDPEEERLAERLRAFAESHGMTLRR